MGQLHQPEIDEFRLDSAVDGQEEIERFEIAMHDSLVVRGREAVSDRQHDLHGILRNELTVSLEERAERLAVEKLHGEVRIVPR